jgi:NitT/TauT family transport system substrate-binding protein
MKKRLAVMALLVFAGLALAQTKVSMVLNWFPETGHAGYFAAQKDGLYKKAGLDLSIIPGGPNTPGGLSLLATGKAQFAMIGATEALQAREQGIPVVAVFAPFQNNPQGFMYHAENPLKGFEDLAGRTVAISPGAAYWDFVQNKYGLKGKVQVINYNGQLAGWAQDPKAVTQNYITAEPYNADKMGIKNGTLLIADSGFNPYADIIVTTEDFIKSNPEAVRAFVAASKAGYEAFFANPKNYVSVLQDANKENTSDVVLWGAGAIKKLILTGDALKGGLGTMTAERWNTLYKQLKDLKLLKPETNLDVSKVWTLEFLPKK